MSNEKSENLIKDTVVNSQDSINAKKTQRVPKRNNYNKKKNHDSSSTNSNFKTPAELTVADIQNSLVKVPDSSIVIKHKKNNMKTKAPILSIEELINENSLIKPQKTRRTKNLENFKFKKSNLKIIPLGGIEEIGKNITVFEYEDEIILVDCGIEFPTDDMLGVDLVIPDVTYLVKNQEKIKGMFITHGHEDHIGAIPYVLKQVNIPIYGTKLTLELIKNKLEEHGILRSTKMYEVTPGQIKRVGKFAVEFIASCHSIPDAVMLAIHTPVGVVLHTGDFKIDYTPIDGKKMNLGRIAELGNNGVLALLSDSTNSERKGFTLSEKSVGEVLDKLFQHCSKRIVVATFASNVHRVQQIVDCAVKYGRKVAVCGRSMENTINAAKDIGYIKVPDDVFINIDMIRNYTDEQLVIITTGSQGETMSALTRMAAGNHRKVSITPNDLVIISANPIPGNEKLVSKVIDDLMKLNAEVVYSALADVHVSGHACQEEQKLILTLAKPKYFIPVHGEYRQLLAHAETAKQLGISPENIFLTSNGRILELNEQEAKFTTSVQSGQILVDGLGVGDVGNIVLRDRQHLSQDGLIIIVLTMDSSSGQIVAGPDIISRGFVYVRESETLMDDLKKIIKEAVYKFEEKHVTDWSIIKSDLKESVRDYVLQKTKRDPMILPIIMEI